MSLSSVGRDRELAKTQRVVDRTKAGVGATVVVTGEQGIGKTNLLEAVKGQARKCELAVAASKVEDRDRPEPLLHCALRREPGLVRLIEHMKLSPSDIKPYGDALLDAMKRRAGQQPLIVVLDDFHAIDGTSATVLKRIPELSATPVTIVLARRPPRPTPGWSSPGEDLVADLVAKRATIEITLGPLDRAAVADICRDGLGEEPDHRILRLLDPADGNPRRIRELIDALKPRRRRGRVQAEATTTGDLPPRYAAVIEGWLSELSEDANRLLRAGAVLGTSFPVEPCARLLGTGVRRLSRAAVEAMENGVLEAQRSEWVFRHDVVRDVIYESIPAPERAAWHRMAAGLAVDGGRPVTETADHLVRGGPDGGTRAVALLRQAAAECRAVAPLTAATYLAHALVMLGPQDPLWSDVCAEAVGLLASTRRVEEARRWGEQALQRSDLVPEIRANLLLGLAFGAKQAGHNRMVVEYVDRALGLRSVSRGVRAKLYGLKAHALLYLDYGAGADEAGKRACRAGRLSREYGACALGYTARSVVAQFDGRLDTALELAEAAVDAAEAHGGTVVHRHPKLWRGVAFVALDRFDDGAADYKAAFRESDRLHTRWLHSPLQFHRAHLWASQGLLDDATTEAEAGLVPDLHDDTEQLSAPLHGLLVMIAVQRGQMLTARKHIRQMTRVLARGITVAPELIAWPHALFHFANGQPRRALLEMADVLRQAPGRLLLFSHAPEAAPDLVRMAIAVGDHALAQHVADAARVAADRNRSVVSLTGAALHAEALLHQDLGLFTEAVECLDRSPRRLLRAAALCDAARSGYRTARSEAVESLEKALDLYQVCGAHRGIAQVHNLRHVVGVSSPADGGGSEVESLLDRLTRAQQEIARMVPERRTNRAIADRLDMPEGTVRTHMQEIYRRLDIHTRAELIRIVRAEENGT